MSAALVEYRLKFDTSSGEIALEKLDDAFDEVGESGKRAAKKSKNALDDLGAKIISVNQMTELLKKGFDLVSKPLEYLVNVGAKFEDLRLQLETVLQSSEKAESYFAWIKDFASSTPFQLEGLTQSVILLESFGINGQKYLRTFGDAAAGLKIPLNDLSRVMGQIWSKPRAQSEEMLQLIERGVPVVRILGEELGLTAAQIGDIGNQGIAGQAGFEALTRGMEKYYGGAMEKMSRNWTGLISTLKDKFELFVGRIAESKVFDRLKEKIAGLLELIDRWAEDGTLERFAASVGEALTEGIENLVEMIRYLYEMRETLASIAKTAAGIFLAKKLFDVGASLVNAGQKAATFAKSCVQVQKGVKKASGAVGKFGTAIKGIGGAVAIGIAFGEALAAVFDMVSHHFDKAMEKIQERASVEKKAWEDIRMLYREGTPEIVEKLKAMKAAAHERGVEAGEIAIHLQKHFKSEIDNIKNLQDAKEVQAKAESAIQAEKEAANQRSIAIAQQLAGEIEELAANYGIFYGEKVKELKHEEKLMLQVWRENREYIEKNSDSLLKYAKDASELAEKLKKHASPALKELAERFDATVVTIPQLKDRMKEVEKAAKFLPSVKNDVVDFGVETWKAASKTKKWADNWQDTNAKLAFAKELVNGFKNILSAMGVELDKTTQGLLNLAEGAGNIAVGIVSKDPAQIINGVVQAVGSLISLFTGDGIEEAIDRENGWMRLSEELQERLHSLAEQVGDTHAATSMMLDEIIQQTDINEYNFESYAGRVREILADFDRGSMSLKETQEAMGKSWNSLIEEATRLGMEGNRKLIETIRDLRGRGIEVAEIQEYINSQLGAGMESFSQYLAGIDDQGGYTRAAQYLDGMIRAFQGEGQSLVEIARQLGPQIDEMMRAGVEGGYSSSIMSEIFGIRQFVTENEQLMNSIDSTRSMLEAFGNTGYLTSEIFATAQADALDYYKKLQGAGATEKESLEMLAPLLAKQVWYSQQYGYALDEQTKALIEKAEQQGLDLEKMVPMEERMFEIQNKQLEVLERIEEMFGAKLPRAMERTVAAFGDVNSQARRFSNIKYSGPTGDILSAEAEDPIDAPRYASGGQFWTSGPRLYVAGDNPGGRERITVETESQVREREKTTVKDSGDVIMNFYFAPGTSVNDKETLAREFSEIIEDNFGGINGKIAKNIKEYN